jgi:hypothetical protein
MLALCAKAGLVSTGVVAIDGTKLKANASREANSDYERIAREIVAEAKATDEAEDERYGTARGDELPTELQTSAGRRRWLAEAKRELDAERTTGPEATFEPGEEPPQMPRGRAIDQGRRGWHRDARQRLDERREGEARPIPRSRTARLSESKRRLEEELEAEREADEAYEAYRARGISRDGRRFGGDAPSPYQVPDTPAGKINTTDPDSRLMKAAGGGYVQGYNAQAAVSERQIVLAAEITVDSPDFGHLEPMVDATTRELERAGVEEKPEVAVADPGYWHHEQIDDVAADGIQVLIPPDSDNRKRKGTPRRGWQGGRYEWMRRVLATELGERLYRKRSQTVEPMFGHTKHNRGMGRFHRRGRSAARTEWRLITCHSQPPQAPQPHPGDRNGVNRGPKGPCRHRNRPGCRRSRSPAGFRDSLVGQHSSLTSHLTLPGRTMTSFLGLGSMLRWNGRVDSWSKQRGPGRALGQ